MIIAQISDTHIALDVPDTARRFSDLALAIASINELDPLPDAIVHTGDIVHNGRLDEYAEAAAILAKARMPVHVLVGNKDNRANLRHALPGYRYLQPDCPFVQYAIDCHAVRLLVLDTQSCGNKGEFCRERLGHLSDLAGAETTKPVAVFTHHPPFIVTEGPDRIHFEDQHAMLRLQAVLQGLGRVVAIFSGHVHRAVSGDAAGIPAMVAPATATTLRHGKYPAHLKTRPVYQVHRFDPIGGFASETRIAHGAAQHIEKTRGYRQ